MKQQERSYELRSEKVRSIVGQIPPALVRYGTIILFAVLLIIFGIAYFMPYKQVYSGTITFYDLSEPTTTAYISFANDKALTKIEEPTPLAIHLETGSLDVQLRSIENRRDTLNRYPAIIEVRMKPLNKSALQNSTFDFTLVESSDNLLSHFLPRIKIVHM
ncbi:hypothetical protein [Porphyromonas levii]|uniref:hypothetical protein n=1 Tax=Porphyromonas levii TaxID=28114 RepID=UPI001B8C3F47|nr:hypothetical protein [Porphyromonas levii]MBR8702995.1 hypothetical protein [Porphyromonas levii]MBR8759840.1 hypothetical protein [Porphyromonas levii]MBR8765471.1 hypothetical protein [Porphyromonas levii]MBR8801983.1 hypothetical protein [Porphyromonas levii]